MVIIINTGIRSLGLNATMHERVELKIFCFQGPRERFSRFSKKLFFCYVLLFRKNFNTWKSFIIDNKKTIMFFSNLIRLYYYLHLQTNLNSILSENNAFFAVVQRQVSRLEQEKNLRVELEDSFKKVGARYFIYSFPQSSFCLLRFILSCKERIVNVQEVKTNSDDLATQVKTFKLF